MSENKFIKHLKGEDTAKSVLEIKNQRTTTSFANMPAGTSNANDVYSDHRGNATSVLNGTENWKLDGAALTPATDVFGDGRDYTSVYAVSGSGLWVNATYTFPSTGDPRHPVASVFNPSTKWVLKVCGDGLIVDGGSTVNFTMLVKLGTAHVYSKNFTVTENAGLFSKEFVIDFGEANSNVVKVGGLSTLTVQLLCGTPNASARIYNGMSVLTCLQRKVDASAVSNSSANVEDVLDGNIIPSDYFSNPEFIEQIEDGEDAYAVFTRDGDDVNLSGWTPKDDIATTTQLNAEIQNRINADNALGLRIDNEITARTNADNALGVRIDNVIDDLSAETTARENADITLQNNIDGVANDLSAETTARQNADGVLQGNINTVAGNLSAEITARENADTALQGQITSNKNTMDTHIANTNNPHQVTKAQVGLGNVDNTSDLAKPISTATQTALDGKQTISTANYQMGNENGGWTAMTTAQQNALNSGATTAKINTIATNTQAISDEVARATGAESALSDRITANTNNFANYRTATAQDAIDATLATKTELGNETTARESADNGLQTQIDAIVSKSDVVDIVGTYAELQAYDTSGLGNNDVVKVISDSTHNDAPSYYRWVITGSVGAWSYIGSEAETYTKAQTDALLNGKQNTINDLATIRSGAALGATAVQPGDLATVATSGSYNDLTNKPTIGNGTLTVQANGTTVATFSANQTGNSTANITVPTDTNDLTNTAGFITSSALTPYAKSADLATVATSGSYNDLTNKPTIPAAQVNSDWNANSGVAQILNKPTLGTAASANTTDFATAAQGALADTAVQPGNLATVATSGSYNDLSNKPTIPTVNNPTIRFTQGGVEKGSFSLNQATGDTISLDAGGGGGGSSYHPDLFDWKWADHQLNDVQWLRGDTFSWQSGAVYEAAYQHLADDIDGKTLQSETIGSTTIQFYLADDGHKICPASEESNVAAIYTATGVAWYYIIDTVNERFKLPRRHSQQIVCSVKNADGSWYRLYADGWVEQGGTVTPTSVSDHKYAVNIPVEMADANYNLQVTILNDASNNNPTYASVGARVRYTTYFTVYDTTNVTKDWEVSGQSAIDMTLFQGDEKYLYFYVGEFTQTAIENTAGLNAELFNGKADVSTVAHVVIEFQAPTAGNNYTWYRKYADGWVEQGGKTTQTATSSVNATILFPVEMQGTEYTITFSVCSSVANDGAESSVLAQTSVGMNLHADSMASTSGTKGFMWEVKGMAHA